MNTLSGAAVNLKNKVCPSIMVMIIFKIKEIDISIKSYDKLALISFSITIFDVIQDNFLGVPAAQSACCGLRYRFGAVRTMRAGTHALRMPNAKEVFFFVGFLGLPTRPPTR
jgi:hypothetical protein